jgi:hypothetical protein
MYYWARYITSSEVQEEILGSYQLNSRSSLTVPRVPPSGINAEGPERAVAAQAHHTQRLPQPQPQPQQRGRGYPRELDFSFDVAEEEEEEAAGRGGGVYDALEGSFYEADGGYEYEYDEGGAADESEAEGPYYSDDAESALLAESLDATQATHISF